MENKSEKPLEKLLENCSRDDFVILPEDNEWLETAAIGRERPDWWGRLKVNNLLVNSK